MCSPQPTQPCTTPRLPAEDTYGSRRLRTSWAGRREFGDTNCWYDWSIGAWHFITQRHPDWVGRIAGMWSIELMAAEGATVDMTPVIAWIEDGKYEKARQAIANMLTANQGDLNSRLVNMTKALNAASDIMVKAM